MNRRVILTIAVLTSSAVVLLGGCGSSGAKVTTGSAESSAATASTSTTTESTTPNNQSTTTTPSTTTAPTTTSVTTGLDACALVTLAQAESVTGTSLVADANSFNTRGDHCTYLPADPSNSLTMVKVTLTRTVAGAAIATPITAPGATAAVVPNLGDHALAITNVPVGAVIVSKGTTTIAINVTDSQTNDLSAEEALAKVALGNLP